MKSARLVDVPGGRLFVRELGSGAPSEPPDPPIAALHGFTLHGGMFAELAAGVGRPIFAADLPGHGRTDIRPIDLPTTLRALESWLASLGPSVLLGYSQGGRLALQLAVRVPRLLAALVVVSAGPGIADAAARAQRRSRDVATAARIERVGLERFLDVWLDQPTIGTTAVSEERRRADRKIREENTAAGIAAALVGYGQGTVPPVLDRLDALATPSVFVAGSEDLVYVEHAATLSRHTGGRFEVIQSAGHNVVLEQPSALAAVVDDVLERVRSRPDRAGD